MHTYFDVASLNDELAAAVAGFDESAVDEVVDKDEKDLIDAADTVPMQILNLHSQLWQPEQTRKLGL